MRNAVRLTAGLWQAEILPDFGMNTIKLTCGGNPVLRSPETTEALAEKPSNYGVPLLLPPNRTEDGRFCFDGKEYSLPINEPAFHNHIHGVVLRSRFRVTEQTENSVAAVYENQGTDFPFPYRLAVRFVLTEEGYRQDFTVTNTGSADMPLTFGLHTVFAEQSQFQVPIGKRWVINERFLPTGVLEERTEDAESYRTGTASRGKLVRGFYTSEGSTARIGRFRYWVSEAFDQWVLWNGNGSQGFCAIEPLQGAVNALNTGEGLLRLQPGESRQYTTVISL